MMRRFSYLYDGAEIANVIDWQLQINIAKVTNTVSQSFSTSLTVVHLGGLS